MADNLLSSFLPDDRASFGIFPQMKPRRRFQDPTGAANVPLDVTRGRVAGLAGLLPDVLNFMGRSPMPTEQFGETQYEPAQQLPYGSEYFLQNLPLKPTSRIGEVAGQAGAFVPLNPMPAARAVAAGARALGPTAVRMGEGYLQRQGLMPGVVPEAPVPPATPLASMIEKPQAPVSELGFYSAAEQAALNLPRKSGTGESFLNDLMKGQDVKKDELSWLGLDDYLKGKPNVTRQEVQDFIANNRVDVREVRLGDKEVKLPSTIGLLKREEILNKYQPKLDALYAEDANYANLTPQRYEELGQEIRALERQRDVEADAAYRIPPLPQLTPTKYERYQLPGGENYREILLTLPFKEPAMPKGYQVTSMQYDDGTVKYFAETPTSRSQSFRTQEEAQAQLSKTASNLKGFRENLESYTSSHFNEPNILAHMRVNDRVDADGKKMLLIEEIQSDWHQAGRETGYKTGKERNSSQVEKELNITTQKRSRLLEEAAALPDSEMTKFKAMNEEIKALGEQATKLNEEWTDLLMEPTRVPDAPFKDTWHQLALKRALKYAADNGYDRVGLTTGRQQADRYQLSKQISEVHYSGTNFKAYDLDGNEAISRTGVKPEDLAGLIGKEPAKKLLEQPKQGTLQSLTGQNLDVGGEGMKKYYDEIYPAFLAKQGKKYNAKTGETRIKTGQGIPGGAPVRYIDISPEMRGGVKKGQPLFTAAPIGGIGLGAGTQDKQQNNINSFIQ